MEVQTVTDSRPHSQLPSCCGKSRVALRGPSRREIMGSKFRLKRQTGAKLNPFNP